MRLCANVHRLRAPLVPRGTASEPSPVLIKTLLQLHLIRDRLHAADSARYPHRAVDIVARAHEAAQLNDALARLDFDTPGDLKLGILEIRSDRIARETRVAQSVECGEQRRGPGERSNERGRGIESRSARCGHPSHKYSSLKEPAGRAAAYSKARRE